jgi:hypothetical protein
VRLLTTGSGEDWILRPVLDGIIPYESLLDTKLALVDIAILNDALDVKAENERRLYEAMERDGDR